MKQFQMKTFEHALKTVSSADDAAALAEMLIKLTNRNTNGDPFWIRSEELVLTALITHESTSSNDPSFVNIFALLSDENISSVLANQPAWLEFKNTATENAITATIQGLKGRVLEEATIARHRKSFL